MADVFISYARTDRAIVETIASFIAEQGYSVWWDKRLVAGQRWDLTIERELRLARCVVVIWTPVSVDREWVHIEAHAARNRGILLPVLLGCKEPPLAFSLVHAIDLTDWAHAAHSRTAFISTLRDLLAADRSSEGDALELPSASTVLTKPDDRTFRQYIGHLRSTLDRDPSDARARLGLAMTYARLKLFDLATRNADELIERHPSEAEGYVYRAVSLLNGRPPRTSKLETIRQVEALLCAASNIDPDNGTLDVILAAIKLDYYAANGLRMMEPTPNELFASAAPKTIDRLEALRVLELIGMSKGDVANLLRSSTQE